ncbi:MAG TPA: hemolysin III family protein [Parachlamydiaceae bacterium]|nr:hemolysin III family protein [Parachlamydiaceae bacterium]
MTTSVICPISLQSDKEELFNVQTHFFGLLFSLIGFIYLMHLAALSEDLWKVASSLLYGTTLILLYTASTYYHSSQTIEKKKRLKIADHACIYLLIAGSYTPFTLGPLREFNGWNLMGIEWSIALIGIIFKVFFIDKFQIVSLFAYLIMGWLVVFSFETLTNEISVKALYWLVAGGISYTAGTVFYVWNSLPFNHGIWHLFVLAGSICHYFCILQLI